MMSAAKKLAIAVDPDFRRRRPLRREGGGLA